MFSLFHSKAKIVAVTVLSELNGTNRKAACCVTFEMNSSNLVLSEFDSQLRHALYEYDERPVLLVEDEMCGLTRLKFPKLGMPLKFDWEGAGYELHLHVGASGIEDIVLDDIALGDFQFTCADGGTVTTKFKAKGHPTASQQGKIDHMLQLETELSLKPPSERQRSLAA
jgi:hypothetical protein